MARPNKPEYQPALSELAGTWIQLAPRERRLLVKVAERLLMGQKAYGPLTRKKKKWKRETAEEMMDGIVYIGCELMDLIDEEEEKS